ncbi:hypothetical protein VNO77_09447 [Canavalia gladiata]|uniref:Uncharacterized protein n=1 Tax=Canavalia gladiata TaxID=3824 RepID=A0AAN9M989_CANGL
MYVHYTIKLQYLHVGTMASSLLKGTASSLHNFVLDLIFDVYVRYPWRVECRASSYLEQFHVWSFIRLALLIYTIFGLG